ncbi:hypothetical protein, partial [Chelatococcus sp. XZ-Ab1]|uniref:hypothetical protein n=1 Tax=Chelatococcus sp. XZ-Ab1 TaxID=3034027 RepID=UPI0023E3F009
TADISIAHTNQKNPERLNRSAKAAKIPPPTLLFLSQQCQRAMHPVMLPPQEHKHPSRPWPGG